MKPQAILSVRDRRIRYGKQAGSKAFFFEKKKQKTFARLAPATDTLSGSGVADVF